MENSYKADYTWNKATDRIAVPIVSHNNPVDAYTLQGVRVEKPQKGIYIQNGKKIVIK